MASPSVVNSETVTLVATTEQHFTSTQWYEWITVTNMTDTTPFDEVYVCVDGGTASDGAAHCMMVPAGQSLTFANQQPLPNGNLAGAGVAYGAGVIKFYGGNMGTQNPTAGGSYGQASGARTQSLAPNWTVQQGYVYASGTPTYCSIVSPGTPNVMIAFE